MKIIISPKNRTKLAKKKPPVSLEEIEQCFVERDRSFLEDTRAAALAALAWISASMPK
jgi:hypothetical protein